MSKVKLRIQRKEKKKTKDTKKRKITVLKNATVLYYEWTSAYKKNRSRFLKVKMRNGGKNMTTKI